MMNRNKLSTIHYGDGLRSRPVILGSLCMDYAHHDPIHSHRVYSLQAVERRLNHHVTMMVNQVMMMVIHTRSPERSEGEAKDLLSRTFFVHVHYRPVRAR